MSSEQLDELFMRFLKAGIDNASLMAAYIQCCYGESITHAELNASARRCLANKLDELRTSRDSYETFRHN